MSINSTSPCSFSHVINISDNFCLGLFFLSFFFLIFFLYDGCQITRTEPVSAVHAILIRNTDLIEID